MPRTAWSWFRRSYIGGWGGGGDWRPSIGESADAESLENLTAVVTGASRGLGRGIARGLGSRGATVYLTGRSIGGTLEQAAGEVDARGGHGVPIVCDHRNDEQVRALFARVAAENGPPDILVNNAAAVYPDALLAPGGFWEKPLRLVDMIDVGLRSNYVASYYAAPLMVAAKRGLIVNISFYGAVSYFHGAAYGAAKAGTDKMLGDMAIDLAPHGCYRGVALARFHHHGRGGRDAAG